MLRRSTEQAASTTGSESPGDDSEPPSCGPANGRLRTAARNDNHRPMSGQSRLQSTNTLHSTRSNRIRKITKKRSVVYRKVPTKCPAYRSSHRHFHGFSCRNSPLKPSSKAATASPYALGLAGKRITEKFSTPPRLALERERGLLNPMKEPMSPSSQSLVAISTPSDASYSTHDPRSPGWSGQNSEANSSDSEDFTSSSGDLDPDWQQTDPVARALREELDKARGEREKMMKEVRNIDVQIEKLSKIMENKE